MRRSDSKLVEKSPWYLAKGPQASRLRKRRFSLAREFGLPPDLLGGSLVVARRRCGRRNCWCADGDGHEQATLTYSVDGSKHVQNIPLEMVEELLPQVEAGLRFRDAVKEIRAINAQLLSLWFVERREKQKKMKAKPARRKSKSRKPLKKKRRRVP